MGCTCCSFTVWLQGWNCRSKVISKAESGKTFLKEKNAATDKIVIREIGSETVCCKMGVNPVGGSAMQISMKCGVSKKTEKKHDIPTGQQ